MPSNAKKFELLTFKKGIKNRYFKPSLFLEAVNVHRKKYHVIGRNIKIKCNIESEKHYLTKNGISL